MRVIAHPLRRVLSWTAAHPLSKHLHWAVLVGLFVVLGSANLLWTSYSVNSSQQRSKQNTEQTITRSRQATEAAIQAAIDINNRSWCDSLDVLTSGPVPTNKQPGTLKLYQDFGVLKHKFGCDK